MPDRTILILATGGTIDKIYADGELITGAPAAAWLVPIAGLADEIGVEPVLAKDSLEVTDDDRALLAERVRGITEGGVVITHGTDTMTETADYLVRHDAARPGVTVVLTGAMQPACMRDSEALFNLGAAITAAKLLEPGVFVAMSGRVFPAGTVVKDRAQGRFVPIADAG